MRNLRIALDLLAAFAVAAVFVVPRLRSRQADVTTTGGEASGDKPEMAHDGDMDPATGLPGRPLIHARSAVLLERLEEDERAAILLLDIDRFRLLNDSFGHAAGDAVLATLAQRLKGAVRDGDIVARVGADEFAVLCEKVTSIDEATSLARRLLGAMTQPFDVHEQQISLGARVGIAVAGPSARTAVDLLRDADMAMTAAKGSSRRFALFHPDMREASRQFLATASDLRHAVSRRQLRVEYQPIVDLPSGDLVAFEALVRWAHPSRGLVRPDEFIPVAEQSGLIAEIGEWVLREAARAAVRWEELCGADAPRVSVNVSAQQLADPDFVYTVTRCIAEFGLAPERLSLEVTESAVMENVEAATESLRVMSGLGTRIALDDFGAGASSLSQLRQLSWVDVLKIDKSFVDGLIGGAEDGAIVRTVIELARALGMVVVAEGIETPEQAEWLSAIGCDLAQGFHFGRSLRPTAADAMILARTRARAELI